MTTLYGIKNCDTVKKACRWLDEHCPAYRFHDFRADGLERALLERLEAALGWESLLNRKSSTWRLLDDAAKTHLDRNKALDLMLAQPALIKRPVLESNAGFLLGFNAQQYASLASNETLQLTEALIRRRSLTPDDAGCMDLLVDRLVPLGFQAEWLNFGDTKNLWLRRGAAQPLFVFLGHTDVVPSGPEDKWTSPPFEPSIRAGKLYGRGAADMKSGVAAMTVAATRFVTQYPNHNGSIAILLTSDEEGDAADGVVRVVEALQARAETIDWCLVGEPSSFDKLGDVIRVGRRGSLSGRLKVFGVQGHVAYPERVKNPILQFAPALHELTRVVWDHGNAFFPPTSFQVSNIHAGTGAENVAPGEMSVLFNLRYSTELDEDAIKRRVSALLDKHSLNYELNWHSSGKPFLTQGSTLIDAVQAALTETLGAPARPDTGGGTSDGRFIAPTGAEVVELGPLNESIHKIDENVPVADLEKLTSIYQKTLEKLLLRP